MSLKYFSFFFVVKESTSGFAKYQYLVFGILMKNNQSYAKTWNLKYFWIFIGWKYQYSTIMHLFWRGKQYHYMQNENMQYSRVICYSCTYWTYKAAAAKHRITIYGRLVRDFLQHTIPNVLAGWTDQRNELQDIIGIFGNTFSTHFVAVSSQLCINQPFVLQKK